jgi:hypothetical protein
MHCSPEGGRIEDFESIGHTILNMIVLSLDRMCIILIMVLNKTLLDVVQKLEH